MGRRLDDFVKKFNLADATVLSMIGYACNAILYPEYRMPTPEPNEVVMATLTMMEHTAHDMVIAEYAERMMKGDDPFDPIIKNG